MQFTRAQLGWPILALLSGGVMLSGLGYAGWGAVQGPTRIGVMVIMSVGAAAIWGAAWGAMWQCAPRPMYRLAEQVGRWLGASPAQLILLGLALMFAALATLTSGRALLAHHAGVSLAAWPLAVICAALGSLDLRETWPRPSRREALAIMALFVAALLMRGVANEQIPSTFSGDEGSSGLFALQYLSGDADNIFTFGWFSFPSFYFALQSIGILIFGQTIPALRFGSALAGALTVLAVFWMARAMFGKTHAWLAAVLLACFHFHIHMSRIALNNVWDGLFAALVMAGLWEGWRNGRRMGFVVCGLALGLGQYFYVSFRIMPVLMIVWSLIALIADRERFRTRLPGLVLAAFVASVVFLPLGVRYLQSPDEFNAPMNRVTILGPRLEAISEESGRTPASILLGQLAKGFMGYTIEPLRLLYDPGAPLLLPLAAIVFTAGVLMSLWKFDLRHALIWLPLAAVPVMGMISLHPPASQRYVMAVPSVMLLLALPLARWVDWVRMTHPYRASAALGVALILAAGMAAADLRYYFIEVQMSNVMRDINTVTATEVAFYLRDHEPRPRRVYFFGLPRMGYFTHSTIPYLLPGVEGLDIALPLNHPPDWPLQGSTQFIFLPERLKELEWVRAAYPGGSYFEGFSRRGEFLFGAYAIELPANTP